MRPRTEEYIKSRWGADEQYYKELEEFHEKHKNADSITYDNASKVPVSANYYFRPWTVYVDEIALIEKLREQADKEEL